MLELRRVNEQLFVAPQIEVEDISAIAEQGIRTIICNRPDDEGQPEEARSDDIRAAALAAGIEFHNLPFSPGQLSIDVVQTFRAIWHSAPSPMLAYCRSGTRSCTLWAISEAGHSPVDEILGAAASAGYDLTGMRDQLGSAVTNA